MSTKVDSPSTAEPCHGQSTGPIMVSSTISASSPKVSMFGTKAGFVIPKNKLSGSLVPIFRGGSKVDAASIVKEESTKQVQRKTKWGTDLTQDATVRKGKALAYQTRVEQITQQLKSGSLELEDDKISDSPKQDLNTNSVNNHFDNKSHKVVVLELERRELIGEILRLNPSYKAPPDYIPVLKESKVPIPIKTYAGYNFIGLLLGPESNTQKRLEEETGAKVRVYGTKSDLGEKREITKADISEAQDAYDELYVLVSADTYEKVDTVLALIELLLTPVSGNAVVTPKVVSSSDGNIENVQTKNPGSGFSTPPVANVIHAVPQPLPVSVQPGQPPFHPYSAPWFPSTTPNVQSHPSSTFMPPFFPNHPTQFPLLRTAPGVPQYFHHPHNIPSLSRASSPTMLRRQFPVQLPPNQSPSGPISQPLTSGPAAATFRPPGPVNPHIGPPIRPLIGWIPAPNAHLARPSLNQMGPHSSNSIMRPPPALPSAPTSSGPASVNFAPHSSPVFSTRPIFSSAPPSQTGLVPTPGMASAPSPSPRPTSLPQIAPSAPVMSPPPPLIVRPPMPMPAPSRTQAPVPVQRQLQPPRPLPAISTSNSTIIPGFPPAANNPIGASPVTTPKPLRPISGDFTFQPLRTQPPSSPKTPTSHSASSYAAAPKAPSFRPAFQQQPLPSEASVLPTAANASNNIRPPPPMLQVYPAQPVSPAIAIGSPSFPRPPQPPNPSGAMPPYTANFQQVHQNQLPHVSRFMAGNAHTIPGGNQNYDPFSPTASPAPPPSHQGDDPAKIKKPETDAEYEDLMASVGVK